MLDKNQWLAIGLVSGFAYILGKDKESFGAESFEAKTPCAVMVLKDGVLTECGWWNENNEPCVYHPDGKEIKAESFEATKGQKDYNYSYGDWDDSIYGVQIYDTDMKLKDVKKMLKDAGIKTKKPVASLARDYGFYFIIDKSQAESFEKAFKKYGMVGSYEYEAESFEANEYSYYHRKKAERAWRKNYEESGILQDREKWNELYDSFDKYKSQGFSKGQSMVKSMKEMGIYNQLMQGVNVYAFLDHYDRQAYASAESFDAEERWYLSDPCYAIPDDRWDEFVDKLLEHPNLDKNKRMDIEWEVDGEDYIVEVWDSPGGDGIWSFSVGEFGVDAGVLAVIPEKVAMEGGKPFDGQWFDKKPTLFTDNRNYIVEINGERNQEFDAESFGAEDKPSCGHEECEEIRGMEGWLSDREIVFKYFTQWRNNDNPSFNEAFFTDSPIQALNSLSTEDMNDIANEQREWVGCYRENWNAESFEADGTNIN